MKTKILTLIAVLIISLLTTSYAYACISNPPATLGNMNIEFTQATTIDNENTQNVATVSAQISYDRHVITVQIRNAYPDYQAQLKYVIKNTGNVAVQFSAPTTVNPHPEAIQLTAVNTQNLVLQPYQTLQGTLTIQILQDAQQNTQYTFEIKNTATIQQPSNPQTAAYWKQQLQTLINNPSQATIDPAILKGYLTAISQQSSIFKFTGTQTQMFQQALNILNPTKHTTEADLKTQLLALWLNQQAAYTSGYKIDGKTSQQIIQISENALQTHQTSRYSTYENQCERFNSL
jgi:hypothetical protein